MSEGQDRDGQYEVGYRKPPKHTRFQKGRSGNPRGRPRGSKGWITLVREAVTAKVEVRENGRPLRTITKLEAAVTQVVNRAATGDLRALALLLGNPAAYKALEPILSRANSTLAFEKARELVRGLL
jgi:Family of unknown function (DUF5681)